MAAGEAFDPSPANIDSRTKRTPAATGLSLALLPKKTNGGQVSVALQHIPQQQTAITQWTGTQAALLSLFMPGLGQMCSGRVPSGLLWMMFTIMGYLCLIVPGFILHVLCVINASRIPRQNS